MVVAGVSITRADYEAMEAMERNDFILIRVGLDERQRRKEAIARKRRQAQRGRR